MTAELFAVSNSFCESYCCAYSAAAGTSARVVMILDTAILAVSIIVLRSILVLYA